MLVITRRKNERVFINGDEIKISILDYRNGEIRLGIEAPENVIVDREEIFLRKLNNIPFQPKAARI